MPGFTAPPFCAIAIITFLFIALTVAERLAPPSQDKTQQLPQSSISLQLPQAPIIALSFQEYKAMHGKQYQTVAQQNYRQHIFYANLKRMNRHNQNKSRTYNMKHNQFLDVSSSEFKEHFTGAYKSDSHSRNLSREYLHNRQRHGQHSTERNQTSRGRHSHRRNHSFQEEISSEVDNQAIISKNSMNSSLLQNSNGSRLLLSSSEQPSSGKVMIDWSIYAGSIKYQGFCGACYAFTAVDTLSGMNAIKKYSFFISLSVQQVIDCNNNGLTFGCSGGYLEGAFSYIQLNGITTEQAYPYTSAIIGKAGRCQKEGGVFKLSSFNSISEGDCNAVINQLTLGPISAGIAGYNLQFYDTGIFNDCTSVLDHAVVIVGYKSGYGWRIKNSWGTRWGQEGFGWIAGGNTCGICNMAVSIVV